MLRRNKALKSFGGAWVFPGGRVDDADLPGGEVIERAKHTARREAMEETSLAVATHDMAVLSQWIPPVQERRRFSTWFFVAPAPNAEVVIDEGEIHDYQWVCPKAVIESAPDKDLVIMPPTYITLSEIAAFNSIDAALADIDKREPERFETKFARHKSGFVTFWEKDAAYETGDLTAPGPRRRLVASAEQWDYQRC